MESVHGTVLYVQSNGSLDLYPQNKPHLFRNVLRNKIRLDPNLRYQISLHQLHVPLYQTCLVANDFEESSIRYNLGVFYCDEKNGGQYNLHENSESTLFRLAPEVNVDAIFTDGELKQFNFDSNSQDYDLSRDVTGKPSHRTLKENFMTELGKVLKLNTSEKNDVRERESMILNFLKDQLSLSDVYKKSVNLSPSNNLIGRFFSDLNYFMFCEFTFLDQTRLLVLMSKIMFFLRYNDGDYLNILRLVSQLPIDIPASQLPNMQSMAYEGASDIPEGFEIYIKSMESQCPSVNSFLGYTNQNIRKIHRKETTVENIQGLVKAECPAHHNYSDTGNDTSGKRKRAGRTPPPYTGESEEAKRMRKLERRNRKKAKTGKQKGSEENDVVTLHSPPPQARSPQRLPSAPEIEPQSLIPQPTTPPRSPSISPPPTPENGDDGNMADNIHTTLLRATVSKNKPFIGIYITFGKRMAKFFNVKENQRVLIAHYGFPTMSFVDYYLKLSPNFVKPKIEKLMVSSNIVSPTIQVGGELASLLDIISAPNSNTLQRPHVGGSFKPLKNHNIDDIAVHTTNIDGDPIHFEKNSVTSYEIHIKPLEEK